MFLQRVLMGLFGKLIQRRGKKTTQPKAVIVIPAWNEEENLWQGQLI